MKKLIKRILKETPSTWFYPPINIGDWQRQCLLCIPAKQLYSQMAGVNCSKPCSENLWNPAVECIMCIIWKATHAQGAQDCGNICSSTYTSMTSEWVPFNVPCYKCDKFGKISLVWNYSQWGASQGPCPSGYAKDPDPFSPIPLEQRNPCDSSVDDNFVRTADDREQTDSPVLFQPSGDENIKGDVEEINESHLKRLIHRVINEQRTVTSYTHTPPSGSCNKDCGQLGTARFKRKAQGKPCNWLKNRSTTLNQKITTKQPGSCQSKRIDCKLQVIHSLIQQQGC